MQLSITENHRYSLFHLPYPIYEVDGDLRLLWANAAGLHYAGYEPISVRVNTLCSAVLHCAQLKGQPSTQIDVCEACELRAAVSAAHADTPVRRMVDLKRPATNGERYTNLLISASRMIDSDRVILSVEEIGAIPGLQAMWEKLERNHKELQDLRTTIGVLLEKHAKAKHEVQDAITLNIRQMVLPCLDKLESSELTPDQSQCVGLLRRRLAEIVSPFLRTAVSLSIHLTQKEAQIADLIRQGKKTPEIAPLLGCSKRAVEFHRDSLRKKLKIKNRKANLREALLKLGLCSDCA